MSDHEVVSAARDETGGQLAPVLPLRDIVVFPHMIVPLFVGREKSVRALEEVMNDEKQILLLTQKNAADDDPSPDGLHTIGTMATVLQLLKLPDQTVRVLVEGKSARARDRLRRRAPISSRRRIETIPDQRRRGASETEALMRTVKTNFEQYIKLNKKVPAETLASVAQIEDPAKLADTVAAHLSVKISDRQALAGNAQHRRAAGEGAVADRRRNRRAAGRAQDPQPRQAPDGEDAARVLSERAAEGDPEGTRRRRGRPRRD